MFDEDRDRERELSMPVRKIVILLLAVGVIAGCQMNGISNALVKGTGWTGGSTAGVSISGFSFDPGSFSFPAANNVAVTWTNNDGVTHTVTSDTGAFASGNLAPGMTFSNAFPAPGTYGYHCSIHTSMKGTITVN